MRQCLRAMAAAALAIATLGPGSLALAQLLTPTAAGTESGGLTEIVVTAEKRSESLQSAPLSITAFSADELVSRGIAGVGGLAAGDVPSVRIVPEAGDQTVLEIALRGFTNPSGAEIGQENPVPVYLDDVYNGRFIAMASELNDLERIEVLQGPQGTLFGKNAEGGAIRLISKDPTGEFGVDATAEGGNYGYRKAIAHVNLPAFSDVAAKIDLLGTDNNGFTDNPAAGQHNFGITQSVGAKLTLLYKPFDALRVEYAGDYASIKETSLFQQTLFTNDPYASVWPVQTTYPNASPYELYRPLSSTDFWGQRITASYSLSDSVTLKSITAFRSDNAPVINTSDSAVNLPGPFLSPGTCALGPAICSGELTGLTAPYLYKHRQFSEELQLTGKTAEFDWVSGLFFLHENASERTSVFLNTVLPETLGGSAATGYLPIISPTSSSLIIPGFGPLVENGENVIASSYAAFGQATWRPPGFDERMAFTAGLRVGYDKKDLERVEGEVFGQVTYPNPDGSFSGGLPCPQTPRCSPGFTETKVNPMASVSYNWTPDVLTYFRYSTGYQAPAVSLGSQIFDFVPASTVQAFELGVKSELADHKLRVNVDGFYTLWDHPQEDVQTISVSQAELISGPTVKITGADVELAYAPAQALTLKGLLTVLHASQPPVVSPFIPPPGFGVTPSTIHIVAVPDWAASVSANYELARMSYGSWRLFVEENGTAPYAVVANSGVMPGYWVLNGRLSLADVALGPDNSRLEISAWGKNIANKSYRTDEYNAPGTAPGTTIEAAAFGNPRTYGLTVNYKFN